MKNAKNLNEQMNRIKSLFTEERLWGNIINEACDNEQEAADYLENLGYIVAEPTSSGARTQRRKLLACLNDPLNVILKKANEEVKHIESASPAARVEITDKPSCSLMITPKVMMGNALRGTIKADGTVYIYWQNATNVIMLGEIIEYVGYKGKTTNGVNYTDLVYDRCYLPSGQPIPTSRTWGSKLWPDTNVTPACSYGGESRSGNPTVSFLEKLTEIKESGTIKELGNIIADSGNVGTVPNACVQ